MNNRLITIITILNVCSCLANDPPAWWHNVIQGEPADYAPANQGQLKFMAQQAHLALQSHLPNTDLSAIDTLTASFTTQHNHQPVNLGQLKWVAAHFYDFFEQNGLQTVWPTGMDSGPYPWTPQPHDDQDHAPANLGQLKYVFSFNLTNISIQDDDQDGLPDAWEIQHLGSTNYLATDDNDNDGLSNLEEYTAGTHPLQSDSDGNGLHDGIEHALATSVQANGSGGVLVMVPDTGWYHAIDPDLDMVYLGSE